MQNVAVQYAPKSGSQPNFHTERRTRRSRLFQSSCDIDSGVATIERLLEIIQKDIITLCRKATKLLRPRLTRNAINSLLHGRHGHLGGKSIAVRAQNLVTIAAAYSWSELLDEPGIGPATAMEVRLWVEERGALLRKT